MPSQWFQPLPSPPTGCRVSTKGPMWGHPVPVLGAISPFLEPFRGRLSPNIDNVSEKLTLRYPHEVPWVVRRCATSEEAATNVSQLMYRSKSVLMMKVNTQMLTISGMTRSRSNFRKTVNISIASRLPAAHRDKRKWGRFKADANTLVTLGHSGII